MTEIICNRYRALNFYSLLIILCVLFTVTRSARAQEDIEPYYRFDKGWVDPFRLRVGVGYILVE